MGASRKSKRTCGQSVEGQAIELLRFERKGARRLLVLGGMHGDEPKSVRLAYALIEAIESRTIEVAVEWLIMPIVNPDGFAIRKRRNAHRVDLNRNFPTKNWQRGNPRSRMFGGDKPASEPETRAVMRIIKRFPPACIVTIHSISGNRYCNNYDGPARSHADVLARHNNYPVTPTIGYPTPGSFGTWAGRERKIPTITLELPSHHSNKQCRMDNLPALQALTKHLERTAR